MLATKAHRTDVILLEPPRKVLRTHHAAPITSEQMEVREALARHFDVPHFEVDGDGVRVVEEFVDGTPISTLSGVERDEAVAEVLRRYACVARDEARSDARELLASHLERARSASRAPHRFTHALTEREPRILARSESWPLTPAHVSSQANNYLLSGDQLIPLDFQNPVYAPFFFDALKLCTTELIQEASRQNRPLVPMIADRYGAGLLPLYQEVEVELTPEVLEDSWLAFAATAMGRGSSRWRRWVGAWDP